MSLNPVRQMAYLVILIAFTLFGCGDSRVAGTSSGVDNPQLTLAFRDSSGLALRVSGDINLYSQDQNPAVDPEPLLTLKLKSSALTNLTGNDIERILSTALDSMLHFNLQLKTENQTGIINFGLTYNSKAKVFSQIGVGLLARLEMRPKTLERFQAKVSRVNSNNQISRIYIPGTPFQATLVDSVFFFEGLPPGSFPLRLLDGDGQIFAVAESLNTDGPKQFTPGTLPIGKVDSTYQAGLDSLLGIGAGPPREAFIEVPSILSAKLVNVDPAFRTADHTEPDAAPCAGRSGARLYQGDDGVPAFPSRPGPHRDDRTRRRVDREVLRSNPALGGFHGHRDQSRGDRFPIGVRHSCR